MEWSRSEDERRRFIESEQERALERKRMLEERQRSELSQVRQQELERLEEYRRNRTALEEHLQARKDMVWEQKQKAMQYAEGRKKRFLRGLRDVIKKKTEERLEQAIENKERAAYVSERARARAELSLMDVSERTSHFLYPRPVRTNSHRNQRAEADRERQLIEKEAMVRRHQMVDMFEKLKSNRSITPDKYASMAEALLKPLPLHSNVSTTPSVQTYAAKGSVQGRNSNSPAKVPGRLPKLVPSTGGRREATSVSPLGKLASPVSQGGNQQQQQQVMRRCHEDR